VEGWEDFVVWDVVTKLIVREQYPQAFQMATQKAAEVFADVLRAATKVSSAGGAVVGRDSMGQRLLSVGPRRLLPPP
jgi:inosine-uridine nucleoside N-ribohydrolase